MTLIQFRAFPINFVFRKISTINSRKYSSSCYLVQSGADTDEYIRGGNHLEHRHFITQQAKLEWYWRFLNSYNTLWRSPQHTARIVQQSCVRFSHRNSCNTITMRYQAYKNAWKDKVKITADEASSRFKESPDESA